MSDLGILIVKLGSLFTGIIEVYIWVVIVTALLSFVNPDPYNPVVQFLHRITQPAYRLVRKFIRTDFNGLDLAPLVIIIGLQVIIIFMNYLLNVLASLV